MRRKTPWRKPVWPWLTALFFISLLLGGVLLPRTGLQRCYEQGELILATTLPEVGAVTAASDIPSENSPATQVLAGEESILVLPAKQEESEEPVEPSGEPQAVIYCTHTSENYSGEKRVNGKPGGVTKAAQALAEGLEARGIAVIFDDSIHDNPYDEAYASSLATICAINEQYPDIELYIDIHRDSAIAGVNTHLTNENGSYAKMMLVIGTDEKYEHPNWQKNFDFSQDVYAELEDLQPGIAREPRTSSNRYNQQIAAKAILVEIGSDDNSVEEAIRSAGILAEALCNVMGW